MEAALSDRLNQIVGPDHFLVGDEDRVLFSQDVSKRSDVLTGGIIQPADKEELAAAVKAATDAGYAVFPRGGGMSYTSGYLPSTEKSVTVDTSRMDRVLEVNLEDMYVTVEAGCTWQTLHETLKDKGVRSPFWGTLSGIHATVGGGMSQNCIFFGSGIHGSGVDSVIGFEVVLADGSILKTGAGAQVNAAPFHRHYGPDLTGLFTSDAGALGIKAVITLKLIRNPEHREFLSFSFDDYNAVFAASAAVSRAGLATESFGFDPYLQGQRMKRQSLASDVKSLTNVMKSSGGALKALKDGAKIALAGRGFMDDVPYSYHFITESHSDAGAKEAAMEIRKICADAGGKEIENSIPKIISANPFTPLNNMVGPEGERWLPVHGLVPHSKAVALMDAITALFEKHKQGFETHGINTGFLIASIGASVAVLEPVFFWPDERNELHNKTVEASAQKGFKDFGPCEEGRALVMQVRGEMNGLFVEHGAVHMQIGKAYPYKQGLDAASYGLVEGLKKQLDPQGLINPGALGL